MMSPLVLCFEALGLRISTFGMLRGGTVYSSARDSDLLYDLF